MDEQTRAPAALRVASYNVRKCIGLDRRRAPERVLDVIEGLNADIIAIQEADRRLGARPSAIPEYLIAANTGMQVVPIAQNTVSLGWHGNAVLVRKGIEVKQIERLNLPFLEPRGAVLVDIARGGHDWRIVAVHLGLTRRLRRRQLQAITDALSRRPALPTIILGDFNEWAKTRGIEPLAENFRVHAPGHSYHSARPIAALDRIATSHDIELERADVHIEAPALTASDHLPIWADVKIRNAA